MTSNCSPIEHVKKRPKASLHAVNDVMKIFLISTWLFSLLSSSQHIFRQSRWYDMEAVAVDSTKTTQLTSQHYTLFILFSGNRFSWKEREQHVIMRHKAKSITKKVICHGKVVIPREKSQECGEEIFHFFLVSCDFDLIWSTAFD